MGDLSPFDFFRQETSNTDVVVRTEAMTKVVIIIALMGADKARSDMVPYLQTKLTDSDQVLLALANKIGDFPTYMGGSDQSHILVPILEALCGIEETAVRTAASISTKKILSQLVSTQKTQIQAFLEMLKRLANDDAGEVFYTRVSACQIIPNIFRIVNESDKSTVSEIFQKLATDEIALVRKAAGISFIAVAECADTDTLCGPLLQLIKALLGDDYSSVKVVAAENLMIYTRMIKKVEAIANVAPELLAMIKATADHPSWRIRLAITKDYSNFVDCFSSAEITADVFPGVIHLIQDPEPDVRTLALQGIVPFIQKVGSSVFLTEFMPIAVQLADDPMGTVRKALAECSVDIAARVGPEAVAHHLTDMIMKIMADEDPLVRLRIIRKLPLIAEEVPSLCTRLTDMLKESYKSTNWRVRKELVLTMPAVVKHMGVDYFSDHFLAGYLTLLKDSVSEVRESCGTILPKMVEAAGSPFVIDKMYPSVRSMVNDEYLIRLNLLNVIEGMLQLDVPDNFKLEVLSLLVGTASDKVANIRIKAAQVMGAVAAFVGAENCRMHIKPALADLQTDKDKDVQYFAATSLKKCA